MHNTDRPVVNRQDVKCNRQVFNLKDMPVARWMDLGSVTRVGNSRRNLKHVSYFTISSRHVCKLQPTDRDYVNNGPHSKKTWLLTAWLQWNTYISQQDTWIIGGHSGRVVTLSPPTSEAVV